MLGLAGTTPVLADTIEAALVRAYQNNPQLNSQRASVRVDRRECAAGACPATGPRSPSRRARGYQYTDTTSAFVRRSLDSRVHGTQVPRASGATVTQTLYNGQQTANRTRAAESQVSAAREGLRVLEQSVLLAAATIYMDYLRDSAIVEVQRSNVRVLEQTLKQTRDRFNVGEVTRTDVAQSEAQLAAGRTQLLAAEFEPDHHARELSAASSATSRRNLHRVRRSIAFCRDAGRQRSIWA